MNRLVSGSDTVLRLQGTLNDLIGVMALPALWRGRGRRCILETLLDGLQGMLRLEFAYGRLSGRFDGSAPVLRMREQPDASAMLPVFTGAVTSWFPPGPPAAPRAVANPANGDTVRVMAFSLGIQESLGLLVVASGREDFPTEVETLVLQVAANQAAIGLQEARRREEDSTQRERSEAESAELKSLLATELAAMTRLHAITTGPTLSPEMLPFLESVLEASIDLLGADFGLLQVHNPQSGVLELVAQRGFQPHLADMCRTTRPGEAACGRALLLGERVVIEDVDLDPGFEPYRALAAQCGFRAVQSTPLFSRAGEALGVISTHFRAPHRPTEHELSLADLYARAAADMIERKRAAEQLRRTQDQLAHVTRVMTMGEITASIAHEVNQPLAAVVTNANAAMRWLAATPRDDEEAHEALRRIVRDALRASEVITRIRTFLRRDDGEVTAVEPEGLVREVFDMVRGEARARDIAMEAQFAPRLPRVLADRVQLQQVLLNLMVNAIEAMSDRADGPGRLTISVSEHLGDKVLFAVCDSGPGLDPENRDRIFDAFFTTKLEGMGMGLAISRSIVEGLGGRLWASQNEGRGETFQFALPRVAATPP